MRNGLIFMVAIPGALLYFLKKMEVSSVLVLFFHIAIFKIKLSGIVKILSKAQLIYWVVSLWFCGLLACSIFLVIGLNKINIPVIFNVCLTVISYEIFS